MVRHRGILVQTGSPFDNRADGRGGGVPGCGNGQNSNSSALAKAAMSSPTGGTYRSPRMQPHEMTVLESRSALLNFC